MKDRIYYSTEEQREIISFLSQPYSYSFSQYEEIFGTKLAQGIFNYLYSSKPKYHYYPSIIPVKKIETSTTKKYLFQLHDHNCIEVVSIRRKTGTTVCVSSQVGCSVMCIFCQSGKKGLIRELSVSEIVQQILFIDEKINRIVFMGTGEPLNNYESVINAIHILRDRNGLNFPTDGITISTVGPIDKLRRLREEHIKAQLVLSLHATDQSTRDLLIPGMIGQSINEVVALTISYAKRHNRKVTIAYLVLPEVNDSRKDIEMLKKWFYGQNIRINLLMYNSTQNYKPKEISVERLSEIKEEIEHEGIEVSIRKSMGNDIHAACGQLSVQ
jgi:23S rRNA (adenine2503-C2)-methyltransferase